MFQFYFIFEDLILWLSENENYITMDISPELQAKRVAAFQAFANDVHHGQYPEVKHEIHMDGEAFERFRALAHQL